MIAPGARLRVERLPLAQLVVTMHEPRHPARLLSYYQRLAGSQDDVLIHVQPLPGGVYGILDGHHRFLASVLAGRVDILAVIVDERQAGANGDQ